MRLNSSMLGVFIFFNTAIWKRLSRGLAILVTFVHLQDLCNYFFFWFALFIFKSKINLLLSILSFGRRICESRARRVFTQLKPTISIFFKNPNMFSFCWKSNQTLAFVSKDTNTKRTCGITLSWVVFKKLFQLRRTVFKYLAQDYCVLKFVKILISSRFLSFIVWQNFFTESQSFVSLSLE